MRHKSSWSYCHEIRQLLLIMENAVLLSPFIEQFSKLQACCRLTSCTHAPGIQWWEHAGWKNILRAPKTRLKLGSELGFCDNVTHRQSRKQDTGLLCTLGELLENKVLMTTNLCRHNGRKTKRSEALVWCYSTHAQTLVLIALRRNRPLGDDQMEALTGVSDGGQ